jgi:hypothetical protein
MSLRFLIEKEPMKSRSKARELSPIEIAEKGNGHLRNNSVPSRSKTKIVPFSSKGRGVLKPSETKGAVFPLTPVAGQVPIRFINTT